MTTDLEIVSWNLRDQINDPALQRSVLDVAPDIAVFPEARSEDTALEQATWQRFENAGYTVYDHAYQDDDGRKDRHALVVAVKPELVRVANSVRLVSRSAIRLTLHGGVDFMGVHLDDRHEGRRLGQAAMAIRYLGESAMVAGDFNAMYPDVGQARLLRTVRPFAKLLPAKDPVPGEKTPKLQRLGSLSQRLTDMASGTTMELFRHADFRDADPTHSPTMKKGPIAAQLDHILYRGDTAVSESTVVEDADGLSDHKRIRAVLRLTD